MGRHREFNLDEALDAALAVFWQKGFEGTSFSDLCEATGVARPGLYSAFGNKEELFRKVLDRYENLYLGFIREAVEQPTAKAVIEGVIRGTAKLLTLKPESTGCLGVNGAVACSDECESVRVELASRRTKSEIALRDRLKRAKSDGDLQSDVSPDDLARYVMTVTQGMSVQAKAGATRKQLERVGQLALQACFS
jgi:AcrR family transcriptional regulator